LKSYFYNTHYARRVAKVDRSLRIERITPSRDDQGEVVFASCATKNLHTFWLDARVCDAVLAYRAMLRQPFAVPPGLPLRPYTGK
jgi:hypothetical protein